VHGAAKAGEEARSSTGQDNYGTRECGDSCPRQRLGFRWKVDHKREVVRECRYRKLGIISSVVVKGEDHETDYQ
jgi:hypothetical protein